MKRKILIIIVAILILAGGIFAVYLNSNYYYSKKLVSAIKEENIIEIRQIIEKKPACINTYPSITSKWWHSAMNWRVFYPMNEACATGNVEIIKLLIDNGADINCNDGYTPLSITYMSKSDDWYQVSLFLIENGASLDYTTELTGTSTGTSVFEDIVSKPLGKHLPIYKPDNIEEVIKAFNYAIENCDTTNVNWMQVLKRSVTDDRFEIVKLLLDDGYCDVNDTFFEMTPLMFAARDSTPEMVQLLLDYGADKSIKKPDGKTAYDYALKSGDEEKVALLEE